MSKLVTERWVGVGWQVGREQVAKHSADGQPLYTGNGEPQVTEVTVLIFVHPPGSDGSQYVVQIPFEEESRQKLVEALTGGIVVPLPAKLPPL